MSFVFVQIVSFVFFYFQNYFQLIWRQLEILAIGDDENFFLVGLIQITCSIMSVVISSCRRCLCAWDFIIILYIIYIRTLVSRQNTNFYVGNRCPLHHSIVPSALANQDVLSLFSNHCSSKLFGRRSIAEEAQIRSISSDVHEYRRSRRDS